MRRGLGYAAVVVVCLLYYRMTRIHFGSRCNNVGFSDFVIVVFKCQCFITYFISRRTSRRKEKHVLRSKSVAWSVSKSSPPGLSHTLSIQLTFSPLDYFFPPQRPGWRNVHTAVHTNICNKTLSDLKCVLSVDVSLQLPLGKMRITALGWLDPR